MKKTIIIAATVALASVSAFAQGNVSFGGILHGVYTASTGTYQASQNDNVALLFFATDPTTTINTIFAGPATGSATNASAGNNSANSGYSTSAAWTALLNGAIQVDGTVASTPAVATITGTIGTFTYNGGTAFSADNLTGGTTYSAIEIAWIPGTGNNNTIALASAAGAYVGWSKVFSYTPTTGSVTPTTLSSSLVGFYGVGGTVVSAPEPGTMALAALGGASLLLFRRRNK